MVQESTIASVKWGVYGLAAMTVIAGVILQCYGLTRVFQVDPSVASHEGLASNSTLGYFLNCDNLALVRPESQNATTGQSGQLDRVYARQCKSKQSPYMYLWAISASLAFLTLPVVAWALYKESRGPILLSSIWLPIAITLLLMSIAGYLLLLDGPSERLIHCNRLDPTEAAEIERQNLGRCVENSEAARHWHKARRILLSGIILNTIGIAFLSWLLPWIFHLSKVRVLLPGTTVKDDARLRAPSETVQGTPIAPTYSTPGMYPTAPQYTATEMR